MILATKYWALDVIAWHLYPLSYRYQTFESKGRTKMRLLSSRNIWVWLTSKAFSFQRVTKLCKKRKLLWRGMGDGSMKNPKNKLVILVGKLWLLNIWLVLVVVRVGITFCRALKLYPTIIFELLQIVYGFLTIHVMSPFCMLVNPRL